MKEASAVLDTPSGRVIRRCFQIARYRVRWLACWRCSGARRGQKVEPSALAADSEDISSRKPLAAHEGELRKLAGEGNAPARRVLAELLAEQEREDDLRDMAAAGDLAARGELAGLLVKQGREDELREIADAGDTAARDRLVELLATRARTDKS
jgi:hypothetical protein